MNRMLMGNPVLLKLSLMLSAKTSIESTMASQILIELAEFISDDSQKFIKFLRNLMNFPTESRRNPDFGERQTRMRLSQNGGDSQ